MNSRRQGGDKEINAKIFIFPFLNVYKIELFC